MDTQFFGVTFEATNQSDRKRCNWCGAIVNDRETVQHMIAKHPQVELSHVRVEPGMVV